MISLLIFLFMNSLVMLSSYCLSSSILKIKGLTNVLISIFILYFSQIVLTELVLGLFGRLNLVSVILVNSLVLILTLMAPRNKGLHAELASARKKLKEIITHKPALFLIVLIVCFGTIKLLINLFNAPFGWDSLNYHFVFPVEWLKHGNLNIPITISDDPSPSFYPINGSLYYLWLIFPFKSVFMAKIGQFPFFILGFIAAFGIARRLGLGKEFSFYSAALFSIIPNYFKQLSVGYVDVMVAALFLTAVYYLFLLDKECSLSNTVLFGISVGLLIGTKTVALPYSLLLIAPFLYISCRNLKRIQYLAYFLLAIIVLGGYSYLRNFFETGNPLYPLDFKLFGINIFNGVMNNNVYRAHFKPEDYSIAKALFHEGLGAQTLIFIFPFVFLALPIAWFKKKRVEFILGYFLLLPLFVYFVYRYVIPLANNRYLYPLMGIGIIAGFYALSLLKVKNFIIRTAVVLCALASMAELAKKAELISSIITTFVVFSLAFLIIKRIEKLRLREINKFIVLILAFVFLALFAGVNNYTKNEFASYKKMVKYSGFWPEATEAWDWLNSNTCGNNIAYIGRPVALPLYGSNFKNNVYYVSVNSIEPARLNYFKGSHYQWGYDFLSLHQNLETEHNYRGRKEYSVWLNNLMKRNTDFLFVYSLHQTKEVEFPIEDAWANTHQDGFIQVFNNKTIHIYRVIK